MNFSVRVSTARALLFGGTVLALSAPPLVWAQQTDTYHFNIAAQPLAQAITQVSEQADIVVLVPQELAADLRAGALTGTMTVMEALTRLLADSGLAPRKDDSGAIIIAPDKKKEAKATKETSATKYIFEEVIVTAEKREESLQDIPIAMSAFSGERIANAGVTGIGDLKQLAPSLQFNQAGYSSTFVSIRGVGTDLRNIGAENGVTITQDGVPFLNQFMFDASFLDIERVEVLRGPQGTISGRNATGGAINIHSKLPTEELEGGLKATIGNYDHFGMEGYLSRPILDDKLLGRIAFRTERADGWLKNTFRDETQNNTDKVQGKASLLTNLGDNLEAYIVLDGKIDRGSSVSSLVFGASRPDQPSAAELAGLALFDPDKLEYQADFRNTRHLENYKGIFKLSWDIGHSASLVATTGYLTFRDERSDDFDGTTAGGFHNSSLTVDFWQFSQEVTLTADLSDQLDMILGGLYLQSRSTQHSIGGSPDSGQPIGSIRLLPEQDLVSYAVYTQWRYRFTDNFRLSIGGRYTYDTKDYFEEDFLSGNTTVRNGSESWGAFTPRIALDYTPTDDLTLYTSISRGFKAGGFNTYGSIGGGLPNDFEPEFVWSYETGMKADWFNQRLRTTSAVFYMEYTNLQQNLRLFSNGLLVPAVRNASSATISGVELEVEAFVTDQLRIGVSGTWMDATYDKLSSVDLVFPELGERILDGNRIVRAPQWQFNLSAEYTKPLDGDLEVVLRANYVWQDDVFFDLFNNELNSQEAFGLLNITAAFESAAGHWTLAGFVRNALDERYILGAFGESTSGRSGHVGTPRMYGLSLAYNF